MRKLRLTIGNFVKVTLLVGSGAQLDTQSESRDYSLKLRK